MFLKPTMLERLLHAFHLLPTPILDGFGHIIFGRALTIAVRRGFFEALAAAPASAEDLAKMTHLSPQGVKLMADAFVAGGYLSRDGTRYRLSAEGKKWLLKESPDYLGNLLHYFETLYARWSDLEYSLVHGRPRRQYFEQFSDEDWRIYVLGMRELATLLLPQVLPKLRLTASAKSLLDVGGSHGLYALACCRRYSSLHATVMDFSPALRFTSDMMATETDGDRVHVLPGDFMDRPFPEGQDGILMFNIIHGFTADENRGLVRRAHGALRAGGKLFILDQMIERRHRSQLAGFVPLMVGLNLLNETGGSAYAVDEVRDWCADFSSTRVHRLRLPGMMLFEAVR